MPSSGAGPTFNAQEGAQLLKIANCMRQHAISDFPDPQRAPTSNGGLPHLGKPGTYSRITNFQGWLLEYPATINMQIGPHAASAAHPARAIYGAGPPPACLESPPDSSGVWAMSRLSINFEPLRIPRGA